MFIEASNNNGRTYLKLIESISYPTTRKGVRKTGKKVILCIGFLDKFDDGKGNYLERLRESFRRGEPIIPELKPYVPEKEKTVVKHTVTFTDGTDDCVQESYLYVHKFLECFFETLEISQVTRSYKFYDGVTYDVYGFVKLMLCGRVLNPGSKIATTRQNGDYYDMLIRDSFDRFDIYGTLDFLYEHKHLYLRRINNIVNRHYPRGSDMICYDVTNFYFETEMPADDDDIRQYGVSKEHRKQPIVQLGLFTDGHGIPIGYSLFKGNTLDCATFREALRSNIDELPSERFVLVGDRGMFAYKNILNVVKSGNGYIVSKSILKSKSSEKEWIFDDDGYTCVSDNFKYKSRIVRHREKDEDGKEYELSEKVVVYWSRKIYDRCVAENKSYLAMVDRILHSDNTFRANAETNKLLSAILGKGKCVDIKSGEILSTKDLRPLLDEEKVERYKKTFGYYQIVTSEINLSDTDVIEKYHGLKQIEDSFRVMKGTLELRPVYVRKEEHIDAHVLICVISLIIIRLIQLKVCEHENDGEEDSDQDREPHWSYCIFADRIVSALNKWKVATLPDNLYMFQGMSDPDLKRILDAYGIEIPKQLYTRQTLKSLKSDIDIFGEKKTKTGRNDTKTEK